MLAMETQAPQLKYCLYARKSSESDERQAMSIDSQLTEMRALAVNEGLNVVCELQESHSAKDSGKRPVYNQMFAGIANDEYNTVLTWAPDRPPQPKRWRLRFSSRPNGPAQTTPHPQLLANIHE